jgi:hypothetical protein
MDYLIAESFEQYALGNNAPAGGPQTMWNLANPGLTTIEATGRFGGKCMKIDSATAILNFNENSTGRTDRGALGFGFKTSQITYSPAQSFMAVMFDGNPQLALHYTTNGAIEVRRGENGTILGTTPNGVLINNTFEHVELVYRIDPAAGAASVFVAGIEKLTLTNVNTRALTHNNVNQIRVQTGGSHQRWWDDIFHTDTQAQVGDCRFETLAITANGAQQDFVANTGAAWDAINDTGPDDDTTYVQSGVVGARSTFTLADLVTVPASVKMLNMRAYARKDDAATRAIKFGVTDGANTLLSASKGLSSFYRHRSSCYSTAPDGGAWTKAKVDALTAVLDVTI